MAPQPEEESPSGPEARQAIAAEALRTALENFAARAGHDLVGPLNQASSLLALLVKRNRNQIGAEADNLLDYLQSSSARMESVISGVRKFMDAARQPKFTDVNLSDSLGAALELLRKPIAESGAIIEANSLPRISADPLQMITLFELVIENCLKFCSSEVVPRIRISCVETRQLADVAVSDNGIGIEPEFCEAVFQPFRRLNGAAYRGAGLGLSTAKLIVDMHGGTMRIESAGDAAGGTCVHLVFNTLAAQANL